MTSRRRVSDPTATSWPGVAEVLVQAAEAAGRAPSIMNSQPWQWRIRDGGLELRADWSRQVHSIDPDGRLLILSCGAALHHVAVALTAAGHEVTTARRPDPADADLLARVHLTGPHEVSYGDVQLRRAMRDRRTDRRPFVATRPVADTVLRNLVTVAHSERVWAHDISSVQLPFLAKAARMAHGAEMVNEHYLADLQRWTVDSQGTGEGVPVETIVTTTAGPVPLRDFAAGTETLLDPGLGDDRFAEYLIVAARGDEPGDWLAAGEATSAVWLTATTQGLAVSPMSDVVEVPPARALVASLLAEPGQPQLILRVGFDRQPSPPPASPRRRGVVEIDGDAAR